MPQDDLVTQTARKLEQDILSGGLAPGDLLPSEREISAEMGVSRSVVRERWAGWPAWAWSAASTAPGRASRRRAASCWPRGIRFFCGGAKSVFWTWPPCACRWRRPSPPRPPAAAPTTSSPPGRGPGGAGQPARRPGAHVKADLAFHAILAEATGNPLFGIVLTPIQELLIESRRRTLGRHGAALAHDHHARILDAVRAGDPAAAAQAMRLHLEANIQHLSEHSEPVN